MGFAPRKSLSGSRVKKNRRSRREPVCIAERLEIRQLLSAAINFPVGTGFTAADTSGVLTLNGNSKLNGTNLELTDGGSSEVSTTFSNSVVAVNGFTTSFAFTQSGSADGMTFCLENVSPTASAGAASGGGGLGYANTTGNGGIPNSIAIKFDLYQNATEGTDSTGLFVNGDSPTVPSGSNPSEASVDMTSSGVVLDTGNPLVCTLVYDGTKLTETVTQTSSSHGHAATATFTHAYTINIPATIGSATAYAGFTGATGGATSTQQVSSWAYTVNPVAPYAPSSTVATAKSSTELDLSWAEPYSNVSSYTVSQQNSAGSFVAINTTSGTTFADIGLTSSTTYNFEVTATNANGSATSAIFSGTTPLRPSLITNLTSTGITLSGVTLNWTNPASGATSVDLTRTGVSDGSSYSTVLPAGTSTYSDSNLSSGSEYDYAVSANTSSGSTQPVTVDVQTIPDQVQDVDDSVLGTTVTLNWNPLGGAVTTYNIYRSTTPGGEGSTPIATGLTATSYNDPGLITGTYYYYTVTAVDTGGEGAQSGEVSALAAAPQSDVIFSEFAADNKTGLTDAAGAYSDWIEVHNAGNGDANLAGYYLSDDSTNPQLWAFPAQTLTAGAYLVVFADGQDISTPNAELHTNFSLSASGEFLGLFGPNNVVQNELNPYPVQTQDISYGLSDSNNPDSAWGYFGTPTPGQPNAPTAAEAVFSTPSQDFSGSISTTLSSPTPGEKIYYTTNGSAPSSSTGTLYTAGATIIVSKTEMVRAVVYATGYTSSVVDSETYIDFDTTVSSGNGSAAAFSNNIGIVVIDTFGQALNDSTDILAAATFIPATNGTASTIGATSASDYEGRIGLHIRGNTSESFPKQQWGITLWDENDDNTKASLFGMPSDDKWILNDPYSEKSLMQNPLSYEWANQAGDYASRTQFVEVFLNTSGNGAIDYSTNYWGVYVLEERIKIASGRVDINSMSPTDTTPPADTGGYIWEKDRPDSGDATFTTTTDSETYIFVDPNADDLNSAQEAYLSNYMNTFVNDLYSSNYANTASSSYYGNFINISTFVNTWLIEEMIKNVDGFRLSTYFYKDENGLICAGPIWDNNLALGNANYSPENNANPMGFGSNPDLFDSSQLSEEDEPIFYRLVQDPAFNRALADRWAQLRTTVFTNADLIADVNNFTAQLLDTTAANVSSGTALNYPIGTDPTQASTNAAVRNFKKWPVLGVYGWPNGWYDAAGNWLNEVDDTENWIIARVTWMDGQFLPSPVITPATGSFSSTATVSMEGYTNTPADTVLVATGATASINVPSGTISGWTSPSYNASAWTTGASSVGYDYDTTTTTTVNPLIGYNDGTAMYNIESTVDERITFNVASVSSIQSLILNMKYDDGFVAYLNGVQVATGNANLSNDLASTAYNATANTSVGAIAAAASFTSFDISVYKTYLVNGTNVLAIQGLNSSKTNKDFFIIPQLVSQVWAPLSATAPVYYTTNGTDPRTGTGAISTSAYLYTGSFNLSSNTLIKARSYVNGVWSGVTTDTLQFSAPTIAITELNYDPAKPPLTAADQQNDDYEFIELMDYGTTPVNLNGIAFTNGIKYTFGNVTLAPGQVGVLVHNTAAFQSRYGTSINIIGDYESTGESFSNSGEEVTLVDPLGHMIADFTYGSTNWFSSPHGNGGSMDVINPINPGNLSSASAWAVDPTANGSPGTVPLPTIGSTEYLRYDPTIAGVDLYINATGSGTPAEVIQTAALNSLSFTAPSAGSSLTIDFSAGNPIPPALGFTFNGGAGATLNITGTTGNDSLVVNGTTAAFNSSSAGMATITYSNATGITFTGGAGSNTLAQQTASTPLTFVDPTSIDTLNVAAGTYKFAAPAPGAGTTQTYLSTLTVSSGATVVLPIAAAYSDHEGVQIGNLIDNGTLDIGNSDLDLPGASLSTVQLLVSTGYNYAGGANWTGTGIVSSLAAGNSNHLTAVGVIQNNQNGSAIYGSGNPFGGLTPAASDVLIKYTYVGDLNLDGVVDGSDYSLIDAGYSASTGGSGTTTGGWLNGDINHDNVIDGSDYALIDNAFNNQAAALKPAAMVAVATAAPTAVVAGVKPTATKRSTFAAKPIAASRAVPPGYYEPTPQAPGTFSGQSLSASLAASTDWFDLLAAGKSKASELI
jgi:hypothetical protein